MPIYEYRCRKCGHEFEELVFTSDKDSPVCEKCGGESEKLMSSCHAGGSGDFGGSSGDIAPSMPAASGCGGSGGFT